MKRKSILLLILSAFMLVPVACGGENETGLDSMSTPIPTAASTTEPTAKQELVAAPLPTVEATSAPIATDIPKTVYYSLADIESIGFVKDEDLEDNWGGETETTELESWNGSMSAYPSEFLSVSIFSETIGTTDKHHMKGFATLFGFRSVFITNVGLFCEKQEVCDYVATKISTELAHVNRTTPLPTPTPPPTPTPNPAFILPLDWYQFFNDIDQNIVAAKAKYAGQKLIFVGLVRTIYEDRVTVDPPLDDNSRYGDSYSYPTINCRGLGSSDLINLLPEYKITVQGISVFDHISDTFATLEPCSILSYTAP